VLAIWILDMGYYEEMYISFVTYCHRKLLTLDVDVYTFFISFLPRDTMRNKCGLCCRPVSIRHVGVLYPDG